MNPILLSMIINSYTFGTTGAAGGAGFIMQEDGTSYLMQQDGTSKLRQE